jgi:hypothetical protein
VEVRRQLGAAQGPRVPSGWYVSHTHALYRTGVHGHVCRPVSSGISSREQRFSGVFTVAGGRHPRPVRGDQHPTTSSDRAPKFTAPHTPHTWIIIPTVGSVAPPARGGAEVRLLSGRWEDEYFFGALGDDRCAAADLKRTNVSGCTASLIDPFHVTSIVVTRNVLGRGCVRPPSYPKRSPRRCNRCRAPHSRHRRATSPGAVARGRGASQRPPMCPRSR